MFAFVILHYLAEEMTKECVGQIYKTFPDKFNYKIVIVDNASPNGSGKELQEYYKNDDCCNVILNDKNDGFARGNNIGFRYAKSEFDPDFIIVMNNDVLIEDSTFLQKIECIYRKEPFYVCGPDIFSVRTGTHQSPSMMESKEAIENSLKEYRKSVCKPRFYFFIDRIRDKIKFRSRLLSRMKKFSPQAEKKWQMQAKDVVLHGACYIFSRNYIVKENQAFDPSTFLFREEEILYLDCKRKGYSMLYEPSLCVKHLEDVSTNYATSKTENNNSFSKYKFINENQYNSLQILLNKMES